jgi:hypothetical protein
MTQSTSNRANVRTVLLLVLLLGFGIGGGAFLFWRSARSSSEKVAGAAEPVLSAATKAALRNLSTPVELRFYTLLDPASTPSSLTTFAERVGLLVSAYEREAGGRIIVTRQTARSDETANAAAQDGLKAFNLEKGDACFLGIAIVQKTQKEPLAQLAPEWEAALESDLTRAIVRVAGGPPAAVSAEAAHQDETASAAVKSAFPDPDSVSAEEGTRRLREAAMKEFQEATKEISVQVETARQQLQQALDTGTADEQQAARQHLQEVQTASNRKLQEIAAAGQARLVAWQRLKGVAAPPATGHGHPPVTAPKR